MNSLIKKVVFLLCLLPLLASAQQCQNMQGPITFNDNFWKKDPKWICPGGELIIKLDASHDFVDERMHFAVRDGDAKDLMLTFSKDDPGPNRQIKFPRDFSTYADSVDTVTAKVCQTEPCDKDVFRSGVYESRKDNDTFWVPKFYTGDLSVGIPDGDPGRLVIITNSSKKQICLFGIGAEESKCGP